MAINMHGHNVDFWYSTQIILMRVFEPAPGRGKRQLEAYRKSFVHITSWQPSHGHHIAMSPLYTTNDTGKL